MRGCYERFPFPIVCKQCKKISIKSSPKAVFCNSKCTQDFNRAAHRAAGTTKLREKTGYRKTYRDTGACGHHWKNVTATKKKCVFCQKEFSTKNPAVAKYCSDRCSTLRLSKETRVYVNEFKLSKGCIDCGYNIHPAALELDHVRGEKIRDVSLINSVQMAKREIEKCVVRCSNCHRIKTWKERGFGEYGNIQVREEMRRGANGT